MNNAIKDVVNSTKQAVNAAKLKVDSTVKVLDSVVSEFPKDEDVRFMHNTVGQELRVLQGMLSKFDLKEKKVEVAAT